MRVLKYYVENKSVKRVHFIYSVSFFVKLYMHNDIMIFVP